MERGIGYQNKLDFPLAQMVCKSYHGFSRFQPAQTRRMASNPSAEEEVMLTGLSHVMLYVNDVSRAAKWYVDTLGFKIRFVAGPHYGILFHDAMKFRLDLHPTREGTQDNVGRGPQAF